MQDNEKKPALRFKGFTDPWEQRKLTEFANFFSGLTYTPNDIREIGVLVLRSSNVINGEIVDADNVYVNPEVVNSENVKEGDIVVVVRNGSRSLIGKHAQIKRFMPDTVIGAFMTGIRSECPAFTNALLNTPHFDEEVSMNMGATINQITGYMFSKMEFRVPTVDEQRQLGAFFENLDALITLHQRKYEKLVNIKKSMLDKMFPKNGASVPEIRFKGFTDPWEQRKLGELVEIGDIDHRMPETVDVGIPYLMTGDFCGTNELNFNGVKLISEIEYNQLSQKIKPEQGDILFARYASVGTVRYVDFTRKFLISYSCAIIKKGKKINSQYLYHFITSDEAQKQIKLQINTGSQSNIGIDSMKNNILVQMPLIDEQVQIANMLTNLDHLITLHQRKLEKLQNIKKSCLEKMFV